MSLSYSNTTSKSGIIQVIERTLGFDDGYISGNATKLAEFTSDINIAYDKALALIFQVGGTWQFDDSNQTDYPIISTNLVLGQQDYSFLQDGVGNLVLEIYKVMVADTTGVYHEIFPVDVSSGNAPTNYDNGLAVQGIPYTYDKLANGIFLDPRPSYNYTNGLKVYVNREAVYFTTSDTTKKPGFAGLFHEYLALLPAQKYAARKGMSIAGGRLRNGSYTGLALEVQDMESNLQEFYRGREKDIQKVLKPMEHNSR